MRFAVVSFPGSNCDDDCVHVVEDVLGETGYKVWHAESSLEAPDVVLLPGGFSYGDYLRCGAIAARSPIMAAVAEFARKGGPVLGICNGFQVLTECGLLPGALGQNAGLKFVCKDVWLHVEGRETPFTKGLAANIKVPVAHHEGNYFADAETLARLEGEGQIVFRYEDNPNGAIGDIAGICNAGGNVVGMMPHPERCAEPLLGNTDGRGLFEAAMAWVAEHGGGA